jgi:hypothetical protein
MTLHVYPCAYRKKDFMILPKAMPKPARQLKFNLSDLFKFGTSHEPRLMNEKDTALWRSQALGIVPSFRK